MSEEINKETETKIADAKVDVSNKKRKSGTKKSSNKIDGLVTQEVASSPTKRSTRDLSRITYPKKPYFT